MALRPEDIEQKVFKERWKGYDTQEVDRFLDQVTQGIRELLRERDGLVARVQELERRLPA